MSVAANATPTDDPHEVADPVLKTYVVTEVLTYEVEADSEEGACEIIAEAADRDQRYFADCLDRSAEVSR